MQLVVKARLNVEIAQNSKQLCDMQKLTDRSKEVVINKKIRFGTVGRWLRPLNGGGRLIEVVSVII